MIQHLQGTRANKILNHAPQNTWKPQYVCQLGNETILILVVLLQALLSTSKKSKMLS